jgi:hypothetical protein
MDSSDKKVLDVIKNEVEDNSKILRKLLRAERMRRWMSIIYWLVIIGLGLGAYYFIQPYIDSLKSVYTDVSDTVKSLDINLPGAGKAELGTTTEGEAGQ